MNKVGIVGELDARCAWRDGKVVDWFPDVRKRQIHARQYLDLFEIAC